MERFDTYQAEEEAVAALPLCIRSLRGPGRARRLPHGSVYRSAGATLQRVLIYGEDGRARVQVVRIDGLATAQNNTVGAHRPQPSSSTFPPPTVAGGAAATASSAVAASSLASPSPSSGGATRGMGLAAEAHEGGISTSRSTHPSSQDAAALHTRSQLRRERATKLAVETERRFEEAQESALTRLLKALPLLRVVPPLSLQQQQYTRDVPPQPSTLLPPALSALGAVAARGRHVGTPAPSNSASGASGTTAPATTSAAVGGTGSMRAALHAAQARYGGFTKPAPRRNVSNCIVDSVSDRAAHEVRRLGLTSAVLLSKDETEEAAAAPVVVTAFISEDGVPTSDSGEALGVHPSAPVSPPPLAIPAPSSSSTDAETFAPLSTDGDATVAALRGTVIDGGFGVTIRLGASCDESSSLRCVTWGGCRPVLLRAVVWRLLSDYAPLQVARQHAELQRKRRQYEGYTCQYCSALTMLSVGGEGGSGAESGGKAAVASTASGGAGSSLSRLPAPGQGLFSSSTSLVGGGGGPGARNGVPNTISGSGSRGVGKSLTASSLTPHEQAILHQMLLDLPRHRSPIFHAHRAVAGMTRCLFLWSQRHPAVGYVQGMDDVVAIFYQVFLTDALRQHARERLARQPHSLSPSLFTAEASTATAGEREVQAGENSASANPTRAVSDVDGWEDDGSNGSGGGASSRSSERSTRAIMHLLLGSLDMRRPTHNSAPSTPTTSNTDTTVVASAASPLGVASDGKASAQASAAQHIPSLTEGEMDVVYATPAALDAALAELPESYLLQVEADTYFCAGRVLSLLQDNFMAGQPGILRSMRRLEALLRQVDPAVISFFDDHGLTVMDGCFQWLHCLLARELPLSLVLRLWDCYLAIGVDEDRSVGFGTLTNTTASTSGASVGTAASDEAIMFFHVCVCCALLRALRTNLMGTSGHTSSESDAAATAAATTMTAVGGWASALVTALPGFRPRAPTNGGGSGSGGDSASSRSNVPIDVVMTAMKRPFEALFPNYPTIAAKQRRPDALRRAATAGEAQEEAAAERWLDLLIAEAYCIWRLHPLNS